MGTSRLASGTKSKMITSSHNPKIQHVRVLINKPRQRRETQTFIIEGVRLAEEALASGWNAELVLYSDQLNSRGMQVVQTFAKTKADIEQVSEEVMASISGTENPQGLLAVLPIRKLSLPDHPDFILIADTIRDPGNLGTLLRTGAAAGVQAVVLSPATVDAFSPKVVRSAMGAHFHLPILRLDWVEIRNILNQSKEEKNLRFYLTDAKGDRNYWEPDFRLPVAISVSSEAEGASQEAVALADEMIKIPMPGKSESLNAAIAAGILLFEVVRQRQTNVLAK